MASGVVGPGDTQEPRAERRVSQGPLSWLGSQARVTQTPALVLAMRMGTLCSSFLIWKSGFEGVHCKDRVLNR